MERVSPWPTPTPTPVNIVASITWSTTAQLCTMLTSITCCSLVRLNKFGGLKLPRNVMEVERILELHGVIYSVFSLHQSTDLYFILSVGSSSNRTFLIFTGESFVGVRMTLSFSSDALLPSFFGKSSVKRSC